MSSIPTVYFIDDSATMREVIKIAFRRENINVVAHQDAATALHEIEQAKPDVVITDVIMPEKDGYEVCQYIKNHPNLGKTPVILMSVVVNRAVAEKAFAVKADELLRKPFQPQDLITRVKHLLKPNGQQAQAQTSAATAAAALTSIFSAASAQQVRQGGGPQRPSLVATASEPPAAGPQPVPISTGRPAAPTVSPTPAPAPTPAPTATAAPTPIPVQSTPPPAPIPITSAPSQPKPQGNGHGTGDVAKLKLEIVRLEGLIKKLQSELAAEREYARALEEHVKTLQESE